VTHEQPRRLALALLSMPVRHNASRPGHGSIALLEEQLSLWTHYGLSGALPKPDSGRSLPRGRQRRTLVIARRRRSSCPIRAAWARRRTIGLARRGAFAYQLDRAVPDWSPLGQWTGLPRSPKRGASGRRADADALPWIGRTASTPISLPVRTTCDGRLANGGLLHR